jgi:hypothetical protein
MIKYKLEALHNVSNLIRPKQVQYKNKDVTTDNDMIIPSENRFLYRIKKRFDILLNMKNK